MTTISRSFPRRGPRAIGLPGRGWPRRRRLVPGLRHPTGRAGRPSRGHRRARRRTRWMQLRSTAVAPRLARSLRSITRSMRGPRISADNPRDFLASTNLAALYQGRARLSYDLGDYERALRAARTALAIEPSHAPARALEAGILYSLHDFVGAFTAADALVRDDPSQIAARGDAVRRLARARPHRCRAGRPHGFARGRRPRRPDPARRGSHR